MMANQRFVINNQDFTGYITSMKWSRNDIDAPNSGRDKSGTMRRGKVCSKEKLQMTCRPMMQAELDALNAALAPETVSVQYVSAQLGLRTSVFYCSSVNAGVWRSGDGDVEWEGVSFDLVEV